MGQKWQTLNRLWEVAKGKTSGNSCACDGIITFKMYKTVKHAPALTFLILDKGISINSPSLDGDGTVVGAGFATPGVSTSTGVLLKSCARMRPPGPDPRPKSTIFKCDYLFPEISITKNDVRIFSTHRTKMRK